VNPGERAIIRTAVAHVTPQRLKPEAAASARGNLLLRLRRRRIGAIACHPRLVERHSSGPDIRYSGHGPLDVVDGVRRSSHVSQLPPAETIAAKNLIVCARVTRDCRINATADDSRAPVRQLLFELRASLFCQRVKFRATIVVRRAQLRANQPLYVPAGRAPIERALLDLQPSLRDTCWIRCPRFPSRAWARCATVFRIRSRALALSQPTLRWLPSPSGSLLDKLRESHL